MRVLSVLAVLVPLTAFAVSLEPHRHWNITELNTYRQHWWRNATGYPLYKPPWWHNNTGNSPFRDYFSTLKSTWNPSHENWANIWNATGFPSQRNWTHRWNSSAHPALTYWKQRWNSTGNSSNNDWPLKWNPSEKADWIQQWISGRWNQTHNWRQRRDVSHHNRQSLSDPQGYSPYTSWVRLPRWNSTGYSPFNNSPPRWGPPGYTDWQPRWNSTGNSPLNYGPPRWNSTATYPNWLPRWF